MSDEPPISTLEYYGSKIPKGIVSAAHHYGHGRRDNDHPRTVARLQYVDGVSLGDAEITFKKCHRKDGVIARHAVDTDKTYYAMDESVVSVCVRHLVQHTSYVVSGGDDEYLPPLVAGEDDQDDVQFPTDAEVVSDTAAGTNYNITD